jgi:hypothetical protein
MKTLEEVMQMHGGIFLVVQVILIIAILAIFIQKGFRYYVRKDSHRPEFIRSHHLILFLGIFSFVWGMFMQLVGFVQALNAIIEAADVSPQLILAGLRNSFINPVIGLSTLLLAALLWAILHARSTAKTQPL